MTRQDAVNLAIAEMGDGTSLKKLQDRASEIYGRGICYTTIKTSRLIWRKRVGKIRDSRTHRDQPGRSEMDLFKVSKVQLRAMFHFEAMKNPTAKDLINMAGKFDSIKQFTNAIKGIKNLKVIQPFSIPAPSPK